jgi:transposase
VVLLEKTPTIKTTLTAKIKATKTLLKWFAAQSKKAAELYNACLDLQMERIANGEKELSAFDMAGHFRSFEMGSDYKDRICERIGDSTSKWVKSESLRYQLYWQHKERAESKDPVKSENNLQGKYPFLEETNLRISQLRDYREHVKRLSRKQKIFGRPRKRKTCSLAFSIRKNRQNTIQIKKNKLEIDIPKFENSISGKYNFLPTAENYQFKLVTLKKDHCGDLWFKVTLEENIKAPQPAPSKETAPKKLVGVDMGLKTTRTAVAVDGENKNIVEIYQPVRTDYFDKGYNALLFASRRDRRHLPFVHRKIARRRHDNIGKDIFKILAMGDEFKFGKPNAAFLLSGRLARSAADAANSTFLTRFAKRAELAGKKAGEVDESYTSVTCRKCLNRKPMPLSIRIYECPVCFHTEDRDTNSAYQIAFRDFREDKTSPSKIKKNGTPSGREMKFKEEIPYRDFQAMPPCKPPHS